MLYKKDELYRIAKDEGLPVTRLTRKDTLCKMLAQHDRRMQQTLDRARQERDAIDTQRRGRPNDSLFWSTFQN